MGYTHYWTHRRRFTNAEWTEIKDDIVAIVGTTDVIIGTSHGDSPIPTPGAVCMDKEILINGVEEDSHETFVIYQDRAPKPEWQTMPRGWDFCKTARKPYDEVVTACLCYLESQYPNKFTASSDGFEHEW
ncbi:hypothetical protein P1J78_22840 [Psychromarinibacter sp. C21-152]|uniref:Uncharacterized protein n=1 Tax=Psychromarinibacter sediminicola TaxID=3033385 RepID=A0AAE3NX33_9RHOB|nr:hypothetical protein [Psychromarinibacter sediminicola]MDF0603571.1 hypothetical protein [Psychromarinibacter sediminicola]